MSLFVVVPSPSWPLSFFPQHNTPPLNNTAHVWDIPTPKLVAVVMPETAVGVLMEFSLEPTPIWPFLLYPQHFIVPSLRRAQLWYSPALTLVTSERPGTAVGTSLSSVSVPNPSCFEPLYPQHFTVPSISDAQE